jgi:hypothetical protein
MKMIEFFAENGYKYVLALGVVITGNSVLYVLTPYWLVCMDCRFCNTLFCYLFK